MSTTNYQISSVATLARAVAAIPRRAVHVRTWRVIGKSELRDILREMIARDNVQALYNGYYWAVYFDSESAAGNFEREIIERNGTYVI